MNKDKRATVTLLAGICSAYIKERTIPHKVLMVIRDAVRELAESEARSIKKMEPFKDREGTTANYNRAVSAWEDLTAAQEALEEGEVDEAHALLQGVAVDPSADPTPTPAKPKNSSKKGLRKK